jgi:UrcA family protein
MLARFNRKTAAVLSGVTASLLLAVPATADQRPVVVYGEQSQLNTERVPYGDLDLSAGPDRKLLYARVGNAVRNVCNFDTAAIVGDYRACSTAAWKDARPQIVEALDRAGQIALTGAPATSAAALTISIRSR